MTLPGDIPRQRVGWDVYEVAETGSTNADLIAAVEQGAARDRVALRADHQTAGRGRRDRRWDAPAGVNLLVSLLFGEPDGDPALLVQAVAVAVVDAIESLAGASLAPRLGVKWPNDVLLDEMKLAGILAQRSSSTGAVVVGVGCNVGWCPDGAASLHANLGLNVTPAGLLDAIIDHLNVHDDVARAHRDRLLTLGEEVRVELPGDRWLEGRAVDVDTTGRLVVDDGATRHVLDVGDVVHLRLQN